MKNEKPITAADCAANREEALAAMTTAGLRDAARTFARKQQRTAKRTPEWANLDAARRFFMWEEQRRQRGGN